MAEKEQQQQQPPTFCANGCGFFGNPLTLNMCSKCYRDSKPKQEEPKIEPRVEKVQQVKEEPVQKPQEPEKTEIPTTPLSPKKDSSRCLTCKKKVGLLGFRCRCDDVFCSKHRHADQHNCQFDYKAHGRVQLQEQNPQIATPKIEKI